MLVDAVGRCFGHLFVFKLTFAVCTFLVFLTALSPKPYSGPGLASIHAQATRRERITNTRAWKVTNNAVCKHLPAQSPNKVSVTAARRRGKTSPAYLPKHRATRALQSARGSVRNPFRAEPLTQRASPIGCVHPPRGLPPPGENGCRCSGE